MAARLHAASFALDWYVLGTGARVERWTLGTVEASKLVEEANDVGGRQGSTALEVFGGEELDWTNQASSQLGPACRLW